MSKKTSLALVALLLTACSGGGSGHASPAPTSTPAAPAPTPYSIEKKCSEDAAGVTTAVVPGPDGMAIQTASVGSGDTVAVLLHQTGGQGLCSMLPLARHLQGSGVRAVALEFCTYGSSVCPASPAQVPQVRAVVDKVRADGAKRVVVVGSSMGAAVALRAAPEVKADAVVALSPVKSWTTECNLATDAARITVPTLVASSPDDKPDLAVARTAVPTVQSDHKVLLEAPGGHGTGMLYDDPLQEKPSAVLQRLTRWVQGDYS